MGDDDDDPFVPSFTPLGGGAGGLAPLKPQPTSSSAFVSTPVLSPQPTGSFRALSPQQTGGFQPQQQQQQQQQQRGIGATLSPQATGASFRAAPPPPPTRSPAPPPPTAVPAELASLRAEHASLAHSVSDLQSTNASLEPGTLDTAKELMDLQAKLISLRSTHTSEQANVERLRARAAEQAREKADLTAEVISAESALSALKAEKDELDGQVMREREDVRGMKRRLGELERESSQAREVVEKVRKEARQQKGLTAIAVKQLSTAEGAREALRVESERAERELEEAEREAREAKEEVERSERAHAESAAAATKAQAAAARSAGMSISCPLFGYKPADISLAVLLSVAAPARPSSSSPASPSSALAAIPAAIASLVPAAIVPAALSANNNETAAAADDAPASAGSNDETHDRALPTAVAQEQDAGSPFANETTTTAFMDTNVDNTRADTDAFDGPPALAVRDLPTPPAVGALNAPKDIDPTAVAATTAADDADEQPTESPSIIAGLATAAAAAVVAAGGVVAAGANEIFSGGERDGDEVRDPTPTTANVAGADEAKTAKAATAAPAGFDSAAPGVVERQQQVEPAFDADADADADSSDDEADGPEDLDSQPSYLPRRSDDEPQAFNSAPAANDGVVPGGVSLSREASSHLASTASAFGSFESTGAAAPAATGVPSAFAGATASEEPAETDPFASDEPEAFAPSPFAAAPAAIAAGIPLPLSPAGSEPPQHSIASAFPPVDARQPTTAAFDDSFGNGAAAAADFGAFDGDFAPVPMTGGINNPFFSAGPAEDETPKAEPADRSTTASPFDAAPTRLTASPLPPAPPAAPSSAAPTPPPIPARREPPIPQQPQQQPPSTAVFDDSFGNDDFDAFDADFEPVPVVARSLAAASTNNPFSAAGGGGAGPTPVYDFDPSFADFDTAFTSTTAGPPAASAVQLAPPISNDAFSVDDAFGSSPFAPAASANAGEQSHASAAPGQHAFDDAFADAPPQQQQQYAAPVGPPPGHLQQPQQQQAERPSLPSRPTEGAGGAAEPDDIPDVKKLVSMGFSRTQALNALEVRLSDHSCCLSKGPDPVCSSRCRLATTICRRRSITSFRGREIRPNPPLPFPCPLPLPSLPRCAM